MTPSLLPYDPSINQIITSTSITQKHYTMRVHCLKDFTPVVSCSKIMRVGGCLVNVAHMESSDWNTVCGTLPHATESETQVIEHIQKNAFTLEQVLRVSFIGCWNSIALLILSHCHQTQDPVGRCQPKFGSQTRRWSRRQQICWWDSSNCLWKLAWIFGQEEVYVFNIEWKVGTHSLDQTTLLSDFSHFPWRWTPIGEAFTRYSSQQLSGFISKRINLRQNFQFVGRDLQCWRLGTSLSDCLLGLSLCDPSSNRSHWWQNAYPRIIHVLRESGLMLAAFGVTESDTPERLQDLGIHAVVNESCFLAFQ